MGIYTVQGKNIYVLIPINMFLGEKTMDAFVVILIAAIVILGALWYFNRDQKSFDVNSDGKVDFKDAGKAVENTVAGVKEVVAEKADVNKDGKVDVADVKVITKRAATGAKKAAGKAKAAAKTAVKKARTPKLKVAK